MLLSLIFNVIILINVIIFNIQSERFDYQFFEGSKIG